MGLQRIQIDWEEVFASLPSPDSGTGVQFETPSSAPHSGAASSKRPRTGGAARASSSDDGKRRRTLSPDRRFQGKRSDLGRRVGLRGRGAVVEEDGGARRPVTRAASKAARQGLDARSPASDAFGFKDEDADAEDVGRKYCVKSSPDLDRKSKYRQLPLIKRQSQRTIPVDKMYKRQPCSTPVSGKLQRVHAIDPDESDSGKFQQSENSSFSRFTKRRKEQLQASSSIYSGKVQDVVLLDDEDMQTEGEVNYEMSGRRNEPKIYYPSRDDPEAVELKGSDINCLEPGAFLSSPVINYYIQNIKRNILCSDDCRDKFYIFNTYFYGKLEEALYRQIYIIRELKAEAPAEYQSEPFHRRPQPRLVQTQKLETASIETLPLHSDRSSEGDFSKLRRWWKGVNIFHTAYIILPIHGMSHWSLVIICMPAKESISGPIILHLDSLGMHRSTKILDTVERYLEEEWRYLKKNPSPDTSVLETTWEDLPSNIHKEKVQVPQQNNAYDCGIFMLYYIRRFIREAPERLTMDKLDMFSCSWFNPEDASDLRRRIRALLLKEFESPRLGNAMSDGAASNGSSIEDSIKGGESEGEAPSDSSEMAVDFGNTGKSNEGIKVAASEEECGVSADAGKSNKGINVAESEEASGESGDASMTIEGINVADSEEATGESGDAGKRFEGYIAESEEESGDLGDALKSIEGINVAEPVEASVELRDAVKSVEFINVAESDEESVELGHAGKTKKGFKVAASEEGSMECVSTDKSMESVSDEEHTSSIRRGERTAGCALSESDSAKDEDGTMKADFDSSKTEKEGLIAIVSPERPRFNEGAIRSPGRPIPDVVPHSESDDETKMEVVRVYRRIINLE